MNDKIYGLDEMVDNLETMCVTLKFIFDRKSEALSSDDLMVAVEAAKSYAAVATAVFNMKASPAYKNTPDYQIEMDLLEQAMQPEGPDREKLPDFMARKARERGETWPRHQQQQPEPSAPERDMDGPELEM